MNVLLSGRYQWAFPERSSSGQDCDKSFRGKPKNICVKIDSASPGGIQQFGT